MPTRKAHTALITKPTHTVPLTRRLTVSGDVTIQVAQLCRSDMPKHGAIVYDKQSRCVASPLIVILVTETRDEQSARNDPRLVR
jgi:hypothetical protein